MQTQFAEAFARSTTLRSIRNITDRSDQSQTTLNNLHVRRIASTALSVTSIECQGRKWDVIFVQFSVVERRLIVALPDYEKPGQTEGHRHSIHRERKKAYLRGSIICSLLSMFRKYTNRRCLHTRVPKCYAIIRYSTLQSKFMKPERKTVLK